VIVVADASAAVKLVLDEPGSDVVRRLWDEDVAWVAPTLVLPEGTAAIAAAERSGRLTTRQAARAHGLFRDVIDQMSLRVVDTDLAAVGADLAQSHGLRGADALYLAVAMEFDDAALLSYDHRQREAADTVGARLSPPR